MGEYVLVPDWNELIKRNLSKLRCVILKVRDAVLPGDREFYMEEARTLIRLHNKMAEHNRTNMRRFHGC